MDVNIGVVKNQSGSAAQPLRTVAALESFAGRVAGRYKPRTFSASRADLALAYEPAPQMNYFQDSRSAMTVSLDFHHHNSYGAGARDVAHDPRPRPDFGEAEASALFARLFSSHNRIAAFEGSGPAALPRSDRTAKGISTLPDAGMEAVERVLPAKAAPQKAAEEGRDTRLNRADNSDSGWGRSPIAPAPVKPFTLPEREVKRVADQVMREIDHRIVARRERWGTR